MEKTNKMVDAIINAMNTEVGQKYTKQMLDQATTEGRVKTQEDWDKMRQDFILYTVANVPEFMSIFAKDVYNELRNN